MSSEKWAQKFHTEDVSLHRSGQDSDSAWGKQIFHIARPIRSSSSLENKESSVPWRMEWLTFFNSCTCIRVTSIILFCPQWRSWQATVYLGCVFLLGKSKSAFPNPKPDCAFFLCNSKKFTFWVDYSDHIQIRNFEIHNLNVFLEKDLKKVFLTIGFPNKNGWNSNWAYVSGALSLSL